MNSTINTISSVDQAFVFIFGISALVLVGISIAMVWFVWRYHHTRNPQADQTDGNLPLEILWTAIPTALVLGMFWYGWVGYKALRDVPPDAMEVKAVGRMWSWQFTYPNGKIAEELTVPVGKAVKVALSSTDVLHSFYVPAFRIKMDVIKGIDTYTWFRGEAVGTHTIYCAEYCGTGHADMLSQVNVISTAAFELWYAAVDSPTTASGGATAATGTASGAVSAGPDPALGKKLLRRNGCTGCHSLDGSESAAPTFKGMFGKKIVVIKQGKECELIDDEAHLRSSIREPQEDILKGFDPIMPKNAALTDAEIEAMIEFLKNHK